MPENDQSRDVPLIDSSDRVDEMTAAAAKGCCNNAAWRFHLCQYHQGYSDGLDAAFEWVRQADGE